MQLARKITFGFSVFLLLLFTQIVAADGIPSALDDDSKTIVLQNATVISMGSSGTFVGSVVVENGKVAALGKDVKVPMGAKVVDLAGFTITPGLIESRSKLWLTPAAITEANTKAELNVIDGVNPWSEDWKELASQGITSVYVQPSSSSLVGGYGAVLRVGPFRTADEIVLKREAALQAAIGVNSATSKDRHALILQLEKLLMAAKEKKKTGGKAGEKSNDNKESEKAEEQKNGDKQNDKSEKPDEDKQDSSDKDEDNKADTSKKTEELSPSTIALRKVLNKEIPLFVEVHHSDSLRKILKLAEKLDIRIVVDGLSKAHSQKDQLVELGYPMVVGPLFRASDQTDIDFGWLAELDGKPFSLSSFANNARSSRMLRVQAAMAMRLGVNRDSVMAAITSNPARALGVADQVGVLEVGKVADIAVFAGDPIDPSTPTRMVMSRGKIVYETECQVVDGSDTDATGLPVRLPKRYAIKSSRLLIDGEFVAGGFTVDDGKVTSMQVENNDRTPVFDLGDTCITPGLVMANSMLGQASTIVDSVESDTSHLRAVDGLDPSNKVAKSALSGGFIHIGVTPGNSNTSAGVVGHIRLGAADYVANPAMANQFVLSRSSRRNGRFPSSLNGQIQLLNELFSGEARESSVYVTPVMKSLLAQERRENIQEVVSQKRKALIDAQSDLEIQSAIRLAKKHGLAATLVSSGRVGQFADALSENQMALVVPVLNGGEFDSQYQQIIEAQSAGVPLAFSGESPELVRYSAAMLVNRGLDSRAALRGLTTGGATAIGMDPVGIAVDAPADFVVWSGSPLNLAAHPLNVIVDGKSVSSNEKL